MTLEQALKALALCDMALAENGDWLSAQWRKHLQNATKAVWLDFRAQLSTAQVERINALVFGSEETTR